MKNLNYLRSKLICLFGLKGSWSWAVKKMTKGNLVTRKSVSGALKYRLSTDGQNRLQNDFHRKESEAVWEDSNLFISDLKAVDYIIYNWKS